LGANAMLQDIVATNVNLIYASKKKMTVLLTATWTTHATVFAAKNAIITTATTTTALVTIMVENSLADAKPDTRIQSV